MLDMLTVSMRKHDRSKRRHRTPWGCCPRGTWRQEVGFDITISDREFGGFNPRIPLYDRAIAFAAPAWVDKPSLRCEHRDEIRDVEQRRGDDDLWEEQFHVFSCRSDACFVAQRSPGAIRFCVDLPRIAESESYLGMTGPSMKRAMFGFSRLPSRAVSSSRFFFGRAGSVAVAACVLGLTLGGCGNSDSDDNDTDQDVTDDTTVRRDVGVDPVDTGDDDVSNDTSRDTSRDSRPTCATQCESNGQLVCFDDTTASTCDDSDGDGCYELVARVACGDDLLCVDGQCEEGPCESECAIQGGSVCTENRTGMQICSDYDGDGCLEFGAVLACVGTTCSGGTCPTSCDANECDAPGDTECQSGGVATCGDFDADGCLEWSDPVDCTGSLVCSDGECGEVQDCLLFGEYVEGEGQNKAYEIFNCGGSSRSLSGISVCLISGNNDGPDCQNIEVLNGSIPAGQVRVYCHASIDGGCANDTTTANYNGDERLVLFRDVNNNDEFDPSTDEVLDSFGPWNRAPDDREWELVTYRRCNLTPFPGTGTFDPLDYYESAASNDLSNLGTPPVADGCN